MSGLANITITKGGIITLSVMGLVILLLAGYGGYVYFTKEEVKSETQSLFEPNENFEPYKDLLGNDVLLTNYLDKIVVVHSWASWCPSCVTQLQMFADSTANNQAEVQIIAINRSEPATTIERFKNTFGINDRVLMVIDPSDRFYTSVGAYTMPETIIYDRAGNKALHVHGEITQVQLEEKIQELLQ